MVASRGPGDPVADPRCRLGLQICRIRSITEAHWIIAAAVPQDLELRKICSFCASLICGSVWEGMLIVAGTLSAFYI